MIIWKLTSIDLNHRDWEASRFRGEIIVRAESEERARKFLAGRLHIATTTPLEMRFQTILGANQLWFQPLK